MSSISLAVKLAKASIPDDLRNDIKNGNYPHVARTADPLLVRPDALSLMVADTVYHAKVKLGLGCKGYYIYASGLGTGIIEDVYTNDSEFDKMFGTNSSMSDSSVREKIEEKAKEWLDELEVAIASHPSDNSIKKAIDRLCWQMHYDITESHLNFPEAFSDNDFADVKIDRYPLDSTYFDGCTLKTTISDVAGVEHSVTESGTTIINQGYFSDASDRIQAFDSHMTKNAYDTDSDGAMKKLQTIIENFDDHLNKGAWDSSNGSLNKIATKLVPDGNYYSISECLRDKDGNNTYSIARSLRDGLTSDVSVSNQIKLQKDSLHEDLGPNGSINSSLSTINTSVGDVNTSVGNVKTDTDTIVTRIGSYSTNTIIGCLTDIMTSNSTVSSNTGTIIDKIGTSYGQDTILGRLLNINGDTTDIKNNM